MSIPDSPAQPNQQTLNTPPNNFRDRAGRALRENKSLIVAELIIALLVVAGGAADIIPLSSTPFLLLLGWVSLWLRRVGWRGVGLKRPDSWARTLLAGIACGVVFQTLSLTLLEPLIAKLTGELPDVSQFASLVGNPVLLVVWLALAWTLAAFGEEMVYRGYLMNRFADAGGASRRSAWIAALLVVTALFGVAHLYQGLSGVIATALSGLIFGLLYLWSGRNLWAPIIAHGVYDTVGFVLIFLGKYPGL